MYIFQPDRVLLRKQIRESAKYIGGVVLDLGAGGHDRYSSFFNAKTKYIKMDVHSGPNTDVVGSADKIPLEDGSVDSVVCTQVFEHLEFPEKSTKEIHRVLKNGGHVLLTVPQMNELHEEPYDFFRYTSFGIKSLFTNVGFELVSESQRGGFFATYGQICIRYCIDRFHLYERNVLGRVLGKFLLVFGKACLWLDTKDINIANRKHALGWCFVFKKI